MDLLPIALLIWIAVFCYLLGEREKLVQEFAEKQKKQLKNGIIRAGVMVALGVPMAYLLPELGVPADPVDIFAGAVFFSVVMAVSSVIQARV